MLVVNNYANKQPPSTPQFQHLKYQLEVVVVASALDNM